MPIIGVIVCFIYFLLVVIETVLQHFDIYFIVYLIALLVPESNRSPNK